MKYYRCNRLSEYLSDDCKGTCHDYDTRRFEKTTGITATAGIGTNMYLCKIAMDIVAKHIETG